MLGALLLLSEGAEDEGVSGAGGAEGAAGTSTLGAGTVIFGAGTVTFTLGAAGAGAEDGAAEGTLIILVSAGLGLDRPRKSQVPRPAKQTSRRPISTPSPVLFAFLDELPSVYPV